MYDYCTAPADGDGELYGAQVLDFLTPAPRVHYLDQGNVSSVDGVAHTTKLKCVPEQLNTPFNSLPHSVWLTHDRRNRDAVKEATRKEHSCGKACWLVRRWLRWGTAYSTLLRTLWL